MFSKMRVLRDILTFGGSVWTNCTLFLHRRVWSRRDILAYWLRGVKQMSFMILYTFWQSNEHHPVPTRLQSIICSNGNLFIHINVYYYSEQLVTSYLMIQDYLLIFQNTLRVLTMTVLARMYFSLSKVIIDHLCHVRCYETITTTSIRVLIRIVAVMRI